MNLEPTFMFIVRKQKKNEFTISATIRAKLEVSNFNALRHRSFITRKVNIKIYMFKYHQSWTLFLNVASQFYSEFSDNDA